VQSLHFTLDDGANSFNDIFDDVFVDCNRTGRTHLVIAVVYVTLFDETCA